MNLIQWGKKHLPKKNICISNHCHVSFKRPKSHGNLHCVTRPVFRRLQANAWRSSPTWKDLTICPPFFASYLGVSKNGENSWNTLWTNGWFGGFYPYFWKHPFWRSFAELCLSLFRANVFKACTWNSNFLEVNVPNSAPHSQVQIWRRAVNYLLENMLIMLNVMWL